MSGHLAACVAQMCSPRCCSSSDVNSQLSRAGFWQLFVSAGLERATISKDEFSLGKPSADLFKIAMLIIHLAHHGRPCFVLLSNATQVDHHTRCLLARLTSLNRLVVLVRNLSSADLRQAMDESNQENLA